jgi:hypothetical protein
MSLSKSLSACPIGGNWFKVSILVVVEFKYRNVAKSPHLGKSRTQRLLSVQLQFVRSGLRVHGRESRNLQGQDEYEKCVLNSSLWAVADMKLRDEWLRCVESTASKDQHKLHATRGSIDLLVLTTSYWSLEASC